MFGFKTAFDFNRETSLSTSDIAFARAFSSPARRAGRRKRRPARHKKNFNPLNHSAPVKGETRVP